MTKVQLRNAWFQVHKWIGLTLAILIIPISLTGSALVWKGWLDTQVEPQRYARLGPASLHPSAYADAARSVLGPGDRMSELRFPKDGGPIVAVAARASEGRPTRTSIWLDPRDAALIDRATGNSGLVQTMHVLHGSLMVPGWGRTIVGWVGAFMFGSCLTGIWLWWPLTGSITSGLRWKRRNTVNANIHYMAGFWVLFPLAMLSATGAWISFPKVFGTFENKAPASDRERAVRAKPLERSQQSVESAVAAAQPFAPGRLASIAWPTDQKPEWRVTFDSKSGPAVVTVADSSGMAKAAPPPQQPETLARKMRRWHDGTGMGPVWQVAIFVGGIIPALLSITGIIIWWRARTPRSRARANRAAVRQPA